MRKILLATTSLVAMSVTAAQADLSISGAYQFEYKQVSSGSNAASSDGNITFKGTNAADNGITYSVVANHAIHASTQEDVYLQIDGDFGTIYMGKGDNSLDRTDGALGLNADVDSNGQPDATKTTVSTANGTESVNFISPSMSGVSVNGTVNESSGKSGIGINYKNDMIEVMYQSVGGGGTDAQSFGAKFSVAGFGVSMGSKESKTGSAKDTATDLAVSYSFDGVKLVALTANGKPGDGSAKSSYKSVGVSYSVAPGVTLGLENADIDSAGSKSAQTWAGLTVAF